jgi:hypothetical protein
MDISNAMLLGVEGENASPLFMVTNIHWTNKQHVRERIFEKFKKLVIDIHV